MSSGEQIYAEFLAEFDALDRFRQRFQERYPAVSLDREDPDVRRLIESLAFFSIRTRHATMHSLRSTWQRLFAGFFDFLLAPVPTATIAQAVVTDRFVEPILIHRGTELRLTTDTGMEGAFRTQRDLRVLPIYLEEMEVRPRGRSGYRLIVRFESRFARKDPIEVLSLYVRHLDSYRTSLAVFHALRKSLTDVSVVYDEDADESSSGSSCEVSFGAGPAAPDDAAEYEHVLARLRASFHLPERDLFVHVKVPPARRPWTRFALCFDLDADWNTGRTLHPDFFQLHCVPIVNLKREMAQPVVADGTQSAYSIRNISAGGTMDLHSVLGVYEVGEDGMEPLRPAYLPGPGASYQVDETYDDDLTPRQSLILRMPEAFDEPRKIAVEALWYQPRFAAEADGKAEVTTPGRFIDGMEWQLAADVRPHLDSPLRQDVFTLVQLLSWRMKPTLTKEELLAVIGYLGMPPESPFRRVPPLLRDVEISVAPDTALQGSGVRHVYRLTLEPFDAAMEPLVHTFLVAVREIADAWNAEATVDVRAFVAGGGAFPLMKGAA